MATKHFCDICKKEGKNLIGVGWSDEYCKRCWSDKKNWPKIHKRILENKRY